MPPTHDKKVLRNPTDPGQIIFFKIFSKYFQNIFKIPQKWNPSSSTSFSINYQQAASDRIAMTLIEIGTAKSGEPPLAARYKLVQQGYPRT